MKKTLLIFSIFTYYFSITNAQIINVVAGNGYDAGTNLGGYTGNGGQATAAELDGPSGIVLDKAGNIYFADYTNNVIRKVTKSTGIISNVAGNGYLATTNSGAYSGDGGPATAAELNEPGDIAFDTIGNLYITDYNNNRIRMVNTSGVISTIAGNGTKSFSGDGGQATAAELNQPEGIVIDHAGNIYIADAANSRVRKIIASTGIITTFAGNATYGYSGDGGPATAAELDYPCGLAFDNSNNLFIADYFNNRIRKVSTSGVITTIVGNGYGAPSSGGYSGDGGQATAGELYNPIDIKLDTAGNFYIADQLNHRLRMISAATGIISTIAGNGISGYNGNGGPATAAELDFPTGVAFDASKNIYLTDGGNNVIQEIYTTTGIELISNSANTLVYPNPSSTEVTFKISSGDNRYIKVSDITGREIETLPILNNEIHLNVSAFSTGIYFYEIINKSSSIVDIGKFTVMK